MGSFLSPIFQGEILFQKMVQMTSDSEAFRLKIMDGELGSVGHQKKKTNEKHNKVGPKTSYLRRGP